MVRLHGVYVPQTKGVDEVEGVPTTYVVSFPRGVQSVIFLVPGCPAVAYSAGQLLDNFMYQLFRLQVAVVQ